MNWNQNPPDIQQDRFASCSNSTSKLCTDEQPTDTFNGNDFQLIKQCTVCSNVKLITYIQTHKSVDLEVDTNVSEENNAAMFRVKDVFLISATYLVISNLTFIY